MFFITVVVVVVVFYHVTIVAIGHVRNVSIMCHDQSLTIPRRHVFFLYRLEGALGNFKFLDLESQNAKKRGRITDPKKVSGNSDVQCIYNAFRAIL